MLIFPLKDCWNQGSGLQILIITQTQRLCWYFEMQLRTPFRKKLLLLHSLYLWEISGHRKNTRSCQNWWCPVPVNRSYMYPWHIYLYLWVSMLCEPFLNDHCESAWRVKHMKNRSMENSCKSAFYSRCLEFYYLGPTMLTYLVPLCPLFSATSIHDEEPSCVDETIGQKSDAFLVITIESHIFHISVE